MALGTGGSWPDDSIGFSCCSSFLLWSPPQSLCRAIVPLPFFCLLQDGEFNTIADSEWAPLHLRSHGRVLRCSSSLSSLLLTLPVTETRVPGSGGERTQVSASGGPPATCPPPACFLLSHLLPSEDQSSEPSQDPRCGQRLPRTRAERRDYEQSRGTTVTKKRTNSGSFL